MTDLIESRQDNHVLEIALNRPDKKNAVNSEMYERLVELLDQAESDDSIRVVVMKGRGGNLTSGNDLGEFQEVPEDADETIAAYQFVKTIALFEKPLITQVEGYAVGLGATMLLHSDLVIADEDSQIRFPFVDLGVVPEAGASLLLPMMAGYQKAAEIIFSADFLSAEEGKEIGFVNEVVEPDNLEQRVQEHSNMIASKAPGSLRATKRLMKDNFRDDLEETIDREMKTFHERLMTDEAMEAIAATMEGREPDFT